MNPNENGGADRSASPHGNRPPEQGDVGSGQALRHEVERVGTALLDLASSRDPELALTLARLLGVIASEACRSPRLANALAKALSGPASLVESPDRPKRSNRRRPGPFDPFSVHAEGGEQKLREELSRLDLEQLRNIIAEHGMDHDRLAMKWKDPERVIDRIVERVAARAAKGSAFR